MPGTDIFHDSHKSIPRSDPRIITQDLGEQQIGARKANLPKPGKNDLTIVHVNKR
jgi:hypothetical protein